MTTEKKLTPEEASPSRENNYLTAAGWVLWVVAAFFIASFVIAAPLYTLSRFGLLDLHNVGTVATFWIDAALYVVMFLIVMWLPWRQWRKNQGNHKKVKEKPQTIKEFLKTNVGLTRWVNITDLKYFAAGLPVFYASVIVLSIIASIFISSDVMSQTQDVGFTATANGFELVVIFIALVFVAPLFEEMMMRGFLFGKLREYLPLWPSAVLVSLLFALAHGQVNVGIMTFILSMFSCRMREKTGVIWAGLFLHMTVNLVAYSVRFLGLGS